MSDATPVVVPVSPAAVRAELTDLILGDLVGPAGGANEVLPRNEQPRDRYLVGMIAPRGGQVEPEREDSLIAGEEDAEEPADVEEPAQTSLLSLIHI